MLVNLLKLGRSELEGVLVTHDCSFKWHKGGYSRNGQVYWYVCAEKVHGCKGTAGIKRMEVTDDNGQLVTINTMEYVSTPAHHNHLPHQAKIISEMIVCEIKSAIASDPITPVGMSCYIMSCLD